MNTTLKLKRPNAPATPRQIMFMEARCIYIPAKCTQYEASCLISEYKESLDENDSDDQHPHDLD